MNAYFIELVRKHGSHGIIIDTNLLLLYLVGVYDLSFIAKFKRTRKYSIEDFNAVSGLAENFRELVTTPQILAEISNLSFQMPESKIGKYFTCLVGVLEKAREHYVEKNRLIRSKAIAKKKAQKYPTVVAEIGDLGRAAISARSRGITDPAYRPPVAFGKGFWQSL